MRAGLWPELRLEAYFDGQVNACGVFQDRFGRVRRQFVCDIDGRYADGVLTLDETFRYDDGEVEARAWKIACLPGGRYEGTAPGVQGVAKGAREGNRFAWTYPYGLKVGARTWTVIFTDQMFLQPDGVIVNTVRVSKLGLDLGYATIAFRRT